MCAMECPRSAKHAVLGFSVASAATRSPSAANLASFPFPNRANPIHKLARVTVSGLVCVVIALRHNSTPALRLTRCAVDNTGCILHVVRHRIEIIALRQLDAGLEIVERLVDAPCRKALRGHHIQLHEPTIESPWFRWRLGLLDFDQGLVGPFRSVEVASNSAGGRSLR